MYPLYTVRRERLQPRSLQAAPLNDQRSRPCGWQLDTLRNLADFLFDSSTGYDTGPERARRITTPCSLLYSTLRPTNKFFNLVHVRRAREREKERESRLSNPVTVRSHSSRACSH